MDGVSLHVQSWFKILDDDIKFRHFALLMMVASSKHRTALVFAFDDRRTHPNLVVTCGPVVVL